MSDYFLNRELSYLKFNLRVLREVDDNTVPLLEKLKYLAIFCSNLDEFFMIRVGSLYEQSLIKGGPVDNKTGWNSERQLKEIFKKVKGLYSYYADSYEKVFARLKEHGIRQLKFDDLSSEQKKWVKAHFKKHILPLLSPQIIASKHPFPHLYNKAVYIIAELKHESSSSFGIIPLPRNAERVIQLPVELCGGEFGFILAEEVICNYVKDVFKAYKISSKAVIRVTRNADITVEDSFADEEVDFRNYMKAILKKRGKLAPVRLEISSSENKASTAKISKYLAAKTGIAADQIFICTIPSELNFLFRLYDSLLSYTNYNKEYYYTPYVPKNPPDIKSNSPMISEVMRKDIFLAYPFHSMKPYLNMLEEAADREDVVSIKITLYRLSSDSRVIEALCRAAENGVEVTAIVELKARFDEENNITWSKRLEEAGCNVIYGLNGFKVHSKITLITMRLDEDISYITHFATGNYNEKTAKLYTDIGIITANRDIGEDAVRFFSSITTSTVPLGDNYKYFLVAPHNMKNDIIKLISDEEKKARLGLPASIKIKMNSLTDKEIIESLVSAGQAGVEITMIIRGICCLLAGVEGYTENIKITSIVGRFLEHSRIFIFGADNEKVYISSADLMTRNTTRRVELAVPVLDRKIAEKIVKMFGVMSRDTVKSSRLCVDAEYRKDDSGAEGTRLNSQEYFCENINGL